MTRTTFKLITSLSMILLGILGGCNYFDPYRITSFAFIVVLISMLIFCLGLVTLGSLIVIRIAPLYQRIEHWYNSFPD